MITVLDPTAEVTTASAELAARPTALTGLTIGFLDNGKPNSDLFLQLLAQRARDAGAGEVVHLRKANIGRLAEPEIIEELIRRCDAVVTGVGDCAGCCSCSVQDAITLERRNVPTWTVVTSELVTIARVAARSAGIPGYPLTVIDHPFGLLSPELLAVRADEAAKLITGSLLAPQPAPGQDRGRDQPVASR